MGTHNRRRRSPTPAQDGKAASRPTHPAAHREHFAGSGAAAGERRSALQIAQRGHRDNNLGGADHVTPDDASTNPPSLVPHAGSQLIDGRHRRLPGYRQPDYQCGGHCTHSSDVGQVGRCRLASHLVRGGPVQSKMHSLNEHISGHHDPAVGSYQHCGVVPGAEQGSRWQHSARVDPSNQAELPQFGHRRRLTLRCWRGTTGDCTHPHTPRSGGRLRFNPLSVLCSLHMTPTPT